jgi:hypothetical protein
MNERQPGPKPAAVRRHTVTSFQINLCSDRPLADPARMQTAIADAISAYLAANQHRSAGGARLESAITKVQVAMPHSAVTIVEPARFGQIAHANP